LTNGSSINANSVSVEKETVVLKVDGTEQVIKKDEILCVIPDGKKGFTFSEKNNKKIKISKKDIYNAYEGTDIPRVFAYKYYKTPYASDQIYNLYGSSQISKDDFIKIFDEQKKTLKNRETISMVAGAVALLIGLSSFLSTMNELNSLSNNNLDIISPDVIDIENNTNFVYRFEVFINNCA
jgi:hypothetical protein